MQVLRPPVRGGGATEGSMAPLKADLLLAFSVKRYSARSLALKLARSVSSTAVR